MIGINKFSFFLFLSLISLNFAENKCCEVCLNETDKYYSIPYIFKNNCGESCIRKEDYKKYKLFEPGLTLANSSTPCFSKGYKEYKYTKVHGFGKLKVAIDFYQ